MRKLKRIFGILREHLKEWIWLGGYMKRYWLTIAFYIFIGIVGVAMGLVMSLAQRDLIDAVTATNKILGDIIAAASVAIALAVSQIFIRAASTWISAHISIRVINEIREDIFNRVIVSRWDALCSYHSGDLINRLEGDVNSVASGVITFLPNLITGLSQFIGAFIIIMVNDPLMAMFALLSAPILVISARPMMKIMRKHNEKMRDVNGRILSFNEEVFQNIQLVKAFSLGADYCKNLRTLLQEYRKIRLDYTKISVVVSIVMGLLGLIAGYSCYAWGVYRLYLGRITFGQMSLFLQLSGTLSSAFSALVRLVPAAVSTATCAGRVMEVTGLPCETDEDAPIAAELRQVAAEQGVRVRFTDVSFTYKDAQEPVLKKVSFTVEPGQVAAFVGPSGGGKTTVLRLMLGLLSPQEGSIDVIAADGSLSASVSESTRRLCSYVPQGNSIFSGTVESNLRSVAPDATEEDIINALKVADAWEFVSELPDTYHTKLSERGLNFSEGQLQRLSIARAVLRNAPILIMDEATSALDVDTEARVLKNLMTENPHRICLITTHRASMLEYSDLVFRVEGDGSFRRVSAEDIGFVLG
ncbi:MAG: ABC transporter ATP-binding protein [Clostridia bacterium]|nr:ABC transporter ATP-binding protein [Clostridia bacterium]